MPLVARCEETELFWATAFPPCTPDGSLVVKRCRREKCNLKNDKRISSQSKREFETPFRVCPARLHFVGMDSLATSIYIIVETWNILSCPCNFVCSHSFITTRRWNFRTLSWRFPREPAKSISH